jgi:hypothetical protein
LKKLFFLALLLPVFANAQIITTIAGTGVGAFSGDGGPATAAEIKLPGGLTSDASGNVYISDWGNARIRKINTSGIISTIAGNGTPGHSGDGGLATAATINGPGQIFVTAAGNIYFSEAQNNIIRKIDASGIISTIAGTGGTGYSGDGGPATDATFNTPIGIAFDAAGNLYIGDFYNNCVRKVNTSGIISTYAGTGTGGYSGDSGPATAAQLYHTDYLITDVADNLYIDDNANHRIRKVTPSGIISTFAGNGFAGSSGDGGPATAASLNYPGGFVFDGSGNFYLAGDLTNNIRKVSAAGIITAIAGSTVAGYSGDGGLATAALLNTPYTVAFNTSGDLMIADYMNSRIRMIGIPDHPPHFTGGSVETLTICAGEVPVSIDTLLAINDPDVGQTETWSLETSPLHGVATVVYTATSTGGVILPSGLTYAPSGTYSGSDMFQVKISDGTDTAIVTINVSINSLPYAGIITGIDSVCPGASVPLSESVTGGLWSSATIAIATVSSTGIAAGIAPGTDTVIYTIINACGIASAIFPVHIKGYLECHTGIIELSGNQNNISLYPNPASSTLTISSTNKISQIIITNLLGQTLITCNYNSEQVEADVTELPAGVYLLKINGIDVRKFVKE